jgi:inhibitor of cysteine peptidase
MQRYSDPDQVVRIATEEAFTIELTGNPTTGYTWQAEVDTNCLELIGQEFKAGGEGAGAAGTEICRFLALSAGETEIEFAYRRPWGGETRETKRFRVVIT